MISTPRILPMVAVAIIWLSGPISFQTVQAQVHEQLFWFVLLDELEYQTEENISWELTSWYGGDYNRVWLKSEGEFSTLVYEGEYEFQVLLSRLITAFWELQAGVRTDHIFGDGSHHRVSAAVGLEGLAPYWIEVEPVIFVSTSGNVMGRLAMSYEMLLTQRTVLTPAFEVNISSKTEPRFDTGTGLTDVELGLRLRHEIRREFSPYVGLSWTRYFGNTLDMRRIVGVSRSDLSAVIGVRLWK